MRVTYFGNEAKRVNGESRLPSRLYINFYVSHVTLFIIGNKTKTTHKIMPANTSICTGGNKIK